MIPFPYQVGQFGLGGSRENFIDAYSTNLWTCCSLKKRIRAYAGSAVRVRRSSDNTEADIGFTSDGALDLAALATHVGANSGYVTTFYDQSGGTKNFSIATASKQPRIVNAGAYDGKLVFDGTDDAFSTGNSGTPSAFTLFFVGKMRSAASTYVVLEQSVDPNENEAAFTYCDTGTLHLITHKITPSGYGVSQFASMSPDNNVQCYRQDRAQTSGATQNVLFVGGAKQTRTGNAGEAGTLPTGSYTARPWHLAARATTSLYAPLDVFDVLIFEAAKSDADIASLSALLAL